MRDNSIDSRRAGNMKEVMGIDIGGTKCAVVIGGLCGGTEERAEDKSMPGIRIIDKISFPTEVHKGPEFTLNRIIEGIDTILKKHKKAGDLAAMGISCGGPLDSKRGLVMSPPNLPGWDNIPIVEMLQQRYGIKVRLQNDANACALAEWKFGAARGYENVIFLTFGTGLGAGLILDGKLYSGTNDMAGEAGHIRLEAWGPVGYGKAGSFEGFCSGGGIAQLARTMVMEKLQRGEWVSFCGDADELAELSAKTVAEAARAGDPLAREIYRISGRYLGRGLSILIDILNPQVIVIGSIFSRNQDLLWPAAQAAIEEESLYYSRKACKILPAGLGEAIGDYASLAVALNE
jgi:glucokinase